MYGKGFLGNMTENLQADCVQSRQAGFMQCFLYSVPFGYPSSSSSKIICSMVSSICTRSSSIRWHFSCIS